MDAMKKALERIAYPDCGCTPICHCNDNIEALAAWKAGAMEEAQEALAESSKVKFKVGDKVRFINPSDRPAATQHNEFIIRQVLPRDDADDDDDDRVFLEGHPGSNTFWWAYRFEFVDRPEAPSMCAGCAGGMHTCSPDSSCACLACPRKSTASEAAPVPKIDGAGVKGCMTSPKDPLELIDPGFMLGIAKVLLYGAKKYAPHNWLRGMSWATVFGGVLRHLFAYFRGEELDPETKLPHLHHAACGIMFLAHYAHGPKSSEYRRFDDRVFKQQEAPNA